MLMKLVLLIVISIFMIACPVATVPELPEDAGTDKQATNNNTVAVAPSVDAGTVKD